MAISQPSYPVETNALVTHVGSYVDGEVSTHAADETSVHGLQNTALVPLVNVFNVTWPTRPTATVVFWIGGDASTDDPSADMEVGDVWYPASE